MKIEDMKGTEIIEAALHLNNLDANKLMRTCSDYNCDVDQKLGYAFVTLTFEAEIEEIEDLESL